MSWILRVMWKFKRNRPKDFASQKEVILSGWNGAVFEDYYRASFHVMAREESKVST